jgi:hypothetical protein
MENKEVIEYNKKCAEFLGYKNTTPNDVDFNIYEKDGRPLIELIGMKYHSDWNWIMEVVEAIEKLSFSTSLTNKLFNIMKVEERIGTTIGSSSNSCLSKKEAVVQAINEFLIWNNES